MDTTAPAQSAAKPSPRAIVKELPDGSLRVIFTDAGSGQVYGIVTAEAADRNTMAALAAVFAQITDARRQSVQVAPADSIRVLDTALRRSA